MIMKKTIFCIFVFFTFLYSKERLVVLDLAAVEILYLLNAQDQIKAYCIFKTFKYISKRSNF